jgi:hypothetical protein
MRQGGKISRYHVVMTACIAPDPRVVYRSDASARLGDYLSAIRFWLSLPDPRLKSLTFLENSGYPLDAIRQAVETGNERGISVDVRNVSDNYIPEGISYGYGELGMLDEASRVCAAFATSDLLIKATGRLCFPALPRWVSSLPGDTRFVVDAVNHHLPWNRTADNGVVRTQLLGFRPDLYREQLFGLRDQLRPIAGYRLIESQIYRFAWQRRHEPGYLLRFPVGCPPTGFAAHWEKRYDSLGPRQKEFAREVARRLAPFLWL